MSRVSVYFVICCLCNIQNLVICEIQFSQDAAYVDGRQQGRSLGFGTYPKSLASRTTLMSVFFSLFSVCHSFFFQSLCLSLTHSFAIIVSSPSICSPANRITIMNITRAFGSEKLLRLNKAVETKVLSSQGFIHNVIEILSNN